MEHTMYLSNEHFFGYAADIVGMEVVQRLNSEVLELGLGNNDRHAGMVMSLYNRVANRPELACEFFSSLRSPGYTTWRNLIWAYAAYDPMKAIAAFGKMEKTHIKPNLDSFRALMYAHAQAETKNEDALKVLVKMKEEYNLQPKIEHIGCYIDKLAAEIECPLSNHICGMIFGECAKSLPADKGSANKMRQVLTRTMLVHFFFLMVNLRPSQ
ncbi:unnamed protein product [Arabidopsis arenosa]|uniref:Pentatricopeptide repeat-containing protein n=1 Tax=Arabidopsis arenosa TaxID=38785 RepID=A0A8S2A7U3_ARAAE|nr:unnamed protein product [Arabidopsis arenosa]